MCEIFCVGSLQSSRDATLAHLGTPDDTHRISVWAPRIHRETLAPLPVREPARDSSEKAQNFLCGRFLFNERRSAAGPLAHPLGIPQQKHRSF